MLSRFLHLRFALGLFLLHIFVNKKKKKQFPILNLTLFEIDLTNLTNCIITVVYKMKLEKIFKAIYYHLYYGFVSLYKCRAWISSYFYLGIIFVFVLTFSTCFNGFSVNILHQEEISFLKEQNSLNMS